MLLLSEQCPVRAVTIEALLGQPWKSMTTVHLHSLLAGPVSRETKSLAQDECDITCHSQYSLISFQVIEL